MNSKFTQQGGGIFWKTWPKYLENGQEKDIDKKLLRTVLRMSKE